MDLPHELNCIAFVLFLDMPIETTDSCKLLAADTAMCNPRVNFLVISQRARCGKNFATRGTRKILLNRGRWVQ